MGDVQVAVGEKPGDTATLLLAAAEGKGGPDVVRYSPLGHFTVPQEVADEAGLDYEGKQAPAKKAAAKKAPAKKTTAKKAAKKSTDKE